MVISQKVFHPAVLDTGLKSCYRLDSGYSKALLGLPEGWCISLGSVISKQSGLEQLKWEPRSKEDNTADSPASESTETLTQERGETAVCRPWLRKQWHPSTAVPNKICLPEGDHFHFSFCFLLWTVASHCLASVCKGEGNVICFTLDRGAMH